MANTNVKIDEEDIHQHETARGQFKNRYINTGGMEQMKLTEMTKNKRRIIIQRQTCNNGRNGTWCCASS